MNPTEKSVFRVLYDFCKERGFNDSAMIIAEELLKPPRKLSLRISDVKDVVCEYFNIPLDQFMSVTRKREVVFARQMAMVLSKRLSDKYKFKWSLYTIGFEIGRKDHATVLHALKTIKNLCDTDVYVLKQYNDLETLILTNYLTDDDIQEVET